MTLLNYEEALGKLKKNLAAIEETESVSLAEAASRVLAEDIFAEMPYPLFDNSAVDGYVLGHPVDKETPWKVTGAIYAGETHSQDIEAGCALRIFTGAPVPPGAYAVVMQEEAEVRGEEVIFTKGIPPQGANIRRKGDDFKKGTLLLQRGTELNAGALSLIASQNKTSIEVFRVPRIAIVGTGNELVEPGRELPPGHIYDTNRIMLEALVKKEGCEANYVHVPDDENELTKWLKKFAEECDMILVTGGASVGEHDFLPRIVEKAGRIVFHRVAIKPGKPFLFGKIEGTPIFGLPGNPASAFVCFEIFVREAIRRVSGCKDAALKWMKAKYLDEHSPHSRDEFIRARCEYENGEFVARKVREQGSFGLRSLADANCLVRISANCSHTPGDSHPILLLR
ncbi:MAG TPA: gephyrin-like molybdotransferase Glp [Fimbriimonadales bacterium]|nr:gephyrin-like molybdotransferase Glp [Fimbriimonadales bacterium]